MQKGVFNPDGNSIDFTKVTTRVHEMFSRIATMMLGEKITVYSGKYSTAAFDLDKRVIFIPVFEGVSMDFYEMVLLHEVGHGLYTPGSKHGDASMVKRAEEVVPGNQPLGFSYINVIEDARIERKVCEKFRGAKRSLVKGYNEVYNKDILQIKSVYEKSKDKLLMIDLLNTKAKLGENMDVPLCDVGMGFYDRMMATDTFDEVVELSKEVYEWSKINEKDKLATLFPDYSKEFEKLLEKYFEVFKVLRLEIDDIAGEFLIRGTMSEKEMSEDIKKILSGIPDPDANMEGSGHSSKGRGEHSARDFLTYVKKRSNYNSNILF